MEMEQVQVKTEVQNVEGNEEILLFYVDENGGNEEGIVTTIQNMDQVHMQEDKVQTIYIEQNETEQATMELLQQEEDSSPDRWSDYATNRLLVFYIDNKETFVSGATKKDFLWSVACKTMLMGKTPSTCDNKLRNLKKKYAQVISSQQNGQPITWSYFELAHQAFHDDAYVQTLLGFAKTSILPDIATPENEDTVVVRQVDVPRNISSHYSNVDEKVVKLLNSYIKHKNTLKNVQNYWQRGLWETIALEMGEENAEYWHKKFLNHKHNYVRLLDKRRDTGDAGITWPYMQLFDQIFGDDLDFQRKYNSDSTLVTPVINNHNQLTRPTTATLNVWNDTEITVLVKYYFDCFDEFQDLTIPNNFLWNEIGRLLDKKPEICKTKYNQLKTEHINKYSPENYSLNERKPVEILFDNIISRETQILFSKFPKSQPDTTQWKTEQIDELAQFLYNNSEMFKDPVCYYVCWSMIANNLMKPIHVCREKWRELVLLYKSILQDKMDNPDLQIDWRYIELFDRLFDYGTNAKLMEGYENLKSTEQESTKVGVKQVNVSMDSTDTPAVENNTDEEFDERGFTTHKKTTALDKKTIKILEFYVKNKEKLNTGKKSAIWAPLSKEIKISSTEINNKLRTLKQVYTSYILQEINKPDKPIVWPFYQLCKKAFGYRALKGKLRQNKDNLTNENEEWSPKEIKQLVAHFALNFHEIENNPSDSKVWTELANSIKKTESACRDKFVELRKSYRKIKTMKAKRSSVKVTWKYYNSIDEIYHLHQNGSMMDIDEYEEVPVDDDIRQDIQEDDDIQCIIVIPEDQDPNDLSDAQIIPNINGNSDKTVSKWTKASKKLLLTLYLNYVKSHKGQEIDANQMWNDISSQVHKSPLACRKIFAKLKQNRLSIEDGDVKKKTPYYTVMEKIVAIKPKFKKNTQKNETNEVTDKVYKDVPMPDETVEKALEQYLQNIEEFVSPKFEKKYAWNNLAKEINEPVSKVFNKINFMKQSFNNGLLENLPFVDKLQDISEKEIVIKAKAGQEKMDATQNDEEQSWSDNETEQLLTWYLENLDKFKNPKFVRKYLWIESSNLLSKSPLACSKKMSEIRTQYRNMVKEKPGELNEWLFYELCQKIYGTGKQKVSDQEEIVTFPAEGHGPSPECE